MEYTPHHWVILNITSDTEPPVRKVFAGWTGGYLDGDSWKASSGITSITEYEDCYLIDNHSGSRYICYKTAYGMTSYMREVYDNWLTQLYADMKIEIDTQHIQDSVLGENIDP